MKEKIRPVGWIKTTRDAKSHIPELIRHETDTKPGEKIPFVINARTVLLYDPKMDADELIASLNVLQQDILLRRNSKADDEPEQGAKSYE